jgi:hypothetical protein
MGNERKHLIARFAEVGGAAPPTTRNGVFWVD